MGNASSQNIIELKTQDHLDPNSIPTLDDLGGFYRPTVSLADELNVQAEWLGDRVNEQVDKMEEALTLGHATTKEEAMTFAGGPKDAGSSMAFGGSSSKEAQLAKQRAQNPKGKLARGTSARKGKSPPGSAGGKRPGSPGRRAAVAAGKAQPIRRAGGQNDDDEEDHWRIRVGRSQRRLFLYLKGYMALVSILKKKQKGYAAPLTAQALPIILTNALGNAYIQFGTHLVKLQAQIAAKNKKQTLLMGGMAKKWKGNLQDQRLARLKAELEGKKEPKKQPVITARFPPRTARPQSEPIPDSEDPPPLPLTFRLPRSRKNARSLVPRGSGGGGAVAAAELAAAQDSVNQAKRIFADIGSLTHKPGADMPKKMSLAEMLTSASPKADTLRALLAPNRGKHKDRNGLERSEDLLSLQMLVNKANSTWVEQHIFSGDVWTPPQVLVEKKLIADGIDVAMYSQVSNNLLAQGKLALHFVYVGEEQVVSIGEGPNATRVPACQVDLWHMLATHFPQKVPGGSRVNGLTLLDRRILQALVDVEKQGGSSAPSKLVIMLCMDARVIPWVAEQAVKKRHWGLQPEQIIFVSIERLPGLSWDNESRVFTIKYGDETTYASASSGYSLLALNWPSHGFTVKKAEEEETEEEAKRGKQAKKQPLVVERNYIAGSVLKHLQQRGVEHIYSSRVCDFESLMPNSCSTPDPQITGPGIYAIDTYGAATAMQVIRETTDQKARWLNSVILAPDEASPYSYNVAYTDVQTTSTRSAVQGVFRAAKVLHSCTSRYLFTVRQLSTAITGPNSFHMKSEVNSENGYAYMHLDIADITSTPGSNCVAVLAPSATRGPEPRTLVFSKDWIRDCSPKLVAQEAQFAFRVRAIACLNNTGAAPQARKQISIAGGGHSDALSPRATTADGSRILVLVRDTAVSRNAYRLARQFIKLPGDQLILMTCVGPSADTQRPTAMLNSFTDVMTDAQTRRQVIIQSGGLVETVERQIENLEPDLVVMGSDLLDAPTALKSITSISSQVTGRAAPASTLSLSSFTLAIARCITDVPLLIVKSTSSGKFFSTDKEDLPLRVMLEAQSASTQPLEWLSPRLTNKDVLYLARPNGLDPGGSITQQTQRMLNNLTVEAGSSFGGNVRKWPMKESSIAFPDLVVDEKIDILTVIAPSASITPPHIIDLIRSVRCNIMIYPIRKNEERM